MNKLVIAAFAAVCLPAFAQAHVTLERQEAAPGQSYKGVLRVGHGCGKSPTISLTVTLPEGLAAVKPMPKAGWTLATERGAYAAPVNVHGKPEAEGVRKIVWSGGRLLDSEYDEFVFASQVSSAAKSPLYVQVVQTCESGEQRWVEIPKDGQSLRDLAYPAAVLRVAAQEKAAAAQGPMRIEQAWSRATPGGATVGAGYLRVTNTGATPDRLVGGSTDAAQRFEIHEMAMDNGVMKMRPLPAGVALAPGESVDLRPGGLHVMMTGLKQPLKQGDAIRATLNFEKAGATPVTFQVMGIGAPGPGPGGAEPEMDHSKHH